MITDVPVVKNVFAYVCLILNVIIPGVGTMVASCLGEETSRGGNKTQMIVGIF